MKLRLPILIANEAKVHYIYGFEKGGGQTDASLSGWAQRKKPKGKRAKRRNAGRAILVDTAHLKNDIDIRRTNFQEIVLGTLDTSYGIYHNEGDGVHQREFLGDSRELMPKINRVVVRELKNDFE